MLSEVGFPVGTPSRYGSALDEEMLRLESASQVSSRRSQRSQRSRRSREPPTWGATTLENDPEPSPEDEPSTSSGLPSGSREVQPVCTGNKPPMFPPPNTRATDEDQLDRQRSVLELSSLLQHAWWEGDDKDDCASKEVARLSHQRTRVDGNRVGLLVDPGAHDNLVGGLTADRMAEQVGTPNKELCVSTSLQAEGVGQNAQSAEHANRIALKLRDVDGRDVPGSFTAPVIQGSALPPLLGLRAVSGRCQPRWAQKAKSFICQVPVGSKLSALLEPARLILSSPPPVTSSFRLIATLLRIPMKTVVMQAGWILPCHFATVPVRVRPQLHAVRQ